MKTENEAGIGRWLYRLRLLIVIYLLVIPIALWERYAARSDDDSSWRALSVTPLTNEPGLTKQVAEVASGLYPNRMSPHFWNGFHAFQGALYDEALHHFRIAMHFHPKDESLLHVYAVTLAIMDENSTETKQAIATWRWNYPHSALQHPLEAARAMHFFPRGLKALEEKNFAKAAKFFERDLISGRLSEELLYYYAVALVLSSDDANHVNTVIDTWKSSFPNSSRVDPRQAAQGWR